jgi:hypothetical protein
VRAPEEPEPSGSTPADLATLEQRLGLPIPADLLTWLLVCRGAAIGPGGFFGHRPDRPSLDMPTMLESFPEWRIRGWIPVAGDGCGNFFVLTASGHIGFVDTIADPSALDGEATETLLAFVDRLLSADQAAP